jgi:L-methionine (R)-S-oxide reductase
MFQGKIVATADKAAFYRELCLELSSLLGDERDLIANAANTSALLFEVLPDVNWVGFYFLRDGKELIVGPFQGKPAGVRIPIGRGVCGAAVERNCSILVEDVHAFPGHIACDITSRSELVVPLTGDGHILGALDLDSPTPARFDAEDQTGIGSDCFDLRSAELIARMAIEDLPTRFG